jgi:Ala-tRNA(Pro) deacylase
MPASRADLFAFFDANGLAHVTHEHAAVHRVEESAQLKAHMPGGHTKNLFMADREGALVLISAEAHANLKLNRLHKVLGTGRLSFTDADTLWRELGVRPGSVTAFALINAPPGRVRFVLDAGLMAFDPLNFHPLENTATTAMTRADVLRFVAAIGHTVETVDFAALAQGD